MAVGSYRGFALWLFEGVKQWPKSVYFWGMFLVGLSLVAGFGGCPAPWPFRIYVTGMVLIIGAIAHLIFKMQYDRYQYELERTERELVRKN